jgi:hypothetical protein
VIIGYSLYVSLVVKYRTLRENLSLIVSVVSNVVLVCTMRSIVLWGGESDSHT